MKKIKVVREFESKLFEVSELESNEPKEHEKPYYVVTEARRNFMVDFEFLTDTDKLSKTGKPKCYDINLNNAREFEDFSHALTTAQKIKSIEFNKNRNYYVVGLNDARIIQMHNEITLKKNTKIKDTLIQSYKTKSQLKSDNIN